MRMLMTVSMPHEPFNTLVRNGSIGVVIHRIMDAIRPEAAYFTEQDGTRGAILVVDVKNSSEIPALAEPFFLNLHADCRFRIAMTPEELGRSGLEELGKKWG